MDIVEGILVLVVAVLFLAAIRYGLFSPVPRWRFKAKTHAKLAAWHMKRAVCCRMRHEHEDSVLRRSEELYARYKADAYREIREETEEIKKVKEMEVPVNDDRRTAKATATAC